MTSQPDLSAVPSGASAEEPPTVPATPNALDKAPAQPTSDTPAKPSNEQEPTAFSWLEPHFQFAVVFVGPEEVPFGLQKDFLCAKSSYYRQYFAGNNDVESIVKLPDTPVEVFAYTQNFLYTGTVFPNYVDLPTYEILVGVWKLGHNLGIDGLCDQTLEAMMEVRQATQSIPAAPLLVQVWKDTPEGSSIRKLLLEWAAEYVRSSESNAEFAKSLPQEVLSELVLAMSRPDTSPLIQIGGSTPNPSSQAQPQRKVVHYLDQEEEVEEPEIYLPTTKKQRRSEPSPNTPVSKPVVKKVKASVPAPKPVPRRRSNGTANGDQDFTTEQKLMFCQDLLARMLSGPGTYRYCSFSLTNQTPPPSPFKIHVLCDSIVASPPHSLVVILKFAGLCH